jgi:hypothetical protein
MKMVVYKAVFRAAGDDCYDRLYPPECSADTVQLVMFRDVPAETTEAGWRVLPQRFHDPNRRRRARHHKCMPHELFPDADYTFWIDGSFTPRIDPTKAIRYLGRNHVAALDHRVRDCAYAEGMRMAQKRRDKPQIIRAQLQRMRHRGYPLHNGLCATGALLRDNSEAVASLGNLWWREIVGGSNRDQISFNYCLWRLKLKWSSLPGRWKDNPLLRWRPHYESNTSSPC